MKAAELYDLDFAQWAEQNAALLRAGKFTDADIEHIAEQKVSPESLAGLARSCPRLAHTQPIN